jgi:hypothetical protein
MPATTVVVTTPDHVIATYRHLAIIIWKVNTTLEGVRALREAARALAGAHPAGIGLLTLVEEGAPAPSGPARASMAQAAQTLGDVVRASAVTFEGDGLRASLVRAVVSGVNLVAKQPFPHQVFATVQAASQWLGPRLGPAIEPREIAQAVAQIRGR